MKTFLRLLVFPILIYIGACNKTEHVTLELEVYYQMYDDVTQVIPRTRRVLLRVDSTLCDGFSHGDSLTVTFQAKQGKLQPISISLLRPSQSQEDEYFKNGRHEGMMHETGECLIGFKFLVTHSEYLATEMESTVTKLVRMYFLANKAELGTDLVEIIDQIDKRPVTRK